MGKQHSMLPVWFFIGILLTIYGIITLITALTELSHPSPAVLSQYHPGIWVGSVLILIGAFYTVRFRPGKDRGK